MGKGFDHYLSALDFQLDSSVIEIANAAQQIKPGRCLGRKRTKPYPLHTTVHEDVRPNKSGIS